LSERGAGPPRPRPAPPAAAPPTLPKRPVTREDHGVRRTDPWPCLRERDDPEVLDHLRAENEWTERALGRFPGRREEILAELKARVVPNTSTPPVRDGPFLYRWRYREGEEYAALCRKTPAKGARWRVLLDGNRLAREAHGNAADGYFHLGTVEVCPKHRLYAYAVDTVGRRIYTIRFLDADTGRLLADEIPRTAPNLVWAETGDTILYVVQDEETLRWERVKRHRLGEPAEEDEVVFHEKDEAFNVSVSASRSREYLLLHCVRTDGAEALAVPSRRPDAPVRVLVPREEKHEFELDHFRGRFYLRTNRGAPDFRLVEAPEDDPGRGWREVVPAEDGTHLEDFELFETHFALFLRRRGRQELEIRRREDGEVRAVPLPGPVRALDPEDNPEPGADEVRVSVSTPRMPPTVLAVRLATGERRRLKRERVPNFRAGDYRMKRLFARAADGARIPLSLVFRADRPPGPNTPLLLYGYGAYGISMDPAFSASRLSLLDRGFLYATAHIRGGQELGRAWYEAGRKEHKTNTFTDFITSAEFLRDRGLCDPERMFALGGSAGGLLIGAVVNLAPDLFRGVVAMVPFVDALNSMLDPTLPLTTGEYDEWGDPSRAEDFRRIAAWSPYENIREAAYPHILATSGLHDSQVQFKEPTKWVLRLRERNTDPNSLILLHTNLDAGHGGRSGRYRGLDEAAMTYAFVTGLAETDGDSGTVSEAE